MKRRSGVRLYPSAMNGSSLPALLSSTAWKGFSVFKRFFGKKRFSYQWASVEKRTLARRLIRSGIRLASMIYQMLTETNGSLFLTTSVISGRLGTKKVKIFFCIRTILETLIIGVKDPFTWGVWVTQPKENFDKYVATYGQDQSSFGSFGWLEVNMPFYNLSDAGAPLTHLECDVLWGTKGQRPKAVLWENTHPLAIDQREWISWRKAIKIANIANLAAPNTEQIN
ncbi:MULTISPECIES: DUF2199 domain-containing protein [unclassified Ruegeria]|uniref:DUF2199 domain-containing protein n=1 Tax=unclassified Ruegeria TaxID=2625375 RepID=UPI001ADA2973|nr:MULTISPECIES: DUF2199 domain-containing protein [unclassified Ruegeria]MBO9417711.1 DUF2199 domain-containing protein [Ruegeria sp. R8_2]